MFTFPKKKGPRTNAPKFEGKMRLRVGDTVRVIAGKDRGKEGKITQVIPSQGKVLVEGINVLTKHQKANPNAPAGTESGRVEVTSPIFAAKVQLVVENGKDTVATRVGYKTDADGNRVRFAKKTGSVIANG